MSGIQRYDNWRWDGSQQMGDPAPNGFWVRYADHEAATAVERSKNCELAAVVSSEAKKNCELAAACDELTEQLRAVTAERDRMHKALKDLSRAYVNTLEAGRDRIIALGGTCDSVEVMERGDPYLRAAREACE